jgi:hypothetical protein
MDVAQFTPFGFATDMYDAGRAGGQGDYATAGTMMAMAFAPGPNVKKFPAFKGMHPYRDDGALIDLTKGPRQHSWSTNTDHAGFFASNPDVASEFARGLSRDGGAVFPAELSFNNPLVIDGGGRKAADFQFGKNADKWKSYFKGEEYAGYDGIILKNVEDAGGVTDIYIPKDPEQISHKLPTKGEK